MSPIVSEGTLSEGYVVIILSETTGSAGEDS